MISIHLQGQRFQVRAAAIILHEGFVLVHQAAGDEYWALPGGRVKVGEEASVAVTREMKEELGEEVACTRLVHVAENFFDLAGQRNHEIGFYFLASLNTKSAYLDKTLTYAGIEKDQNLKFCWLRQYAIASMNVRPAFLRASLAVSSPRFTHEVQRSTNEASEETPSKSLI